MSVCRLCERANERTFFFPVPLASSIVPLVRFLADILYLISCICFCTKKAVAFVTVDSLIIAPILFPSLLLLNIFGIECIYLVWLFGRHTFVLVAACNSGFGPHHLLSLSPPRCLLFGYSTFLCRSLFHSISHHSGSMCVCERVFFSISLYSSTFSFSCSASGFATLLHCWFSPLVSRSCFVAYAILFVIKVIALLLRLLLIFVVNVWCRSFGITEPFMR